MLRSFVNRIAVAGVRRSWTLQHRLVADATTTFAQRTFLVPLRDGMGLCLLDVAPGEHRFVGLLQSLLANRSGAVVDVGANIGRFLLAVTAADETRSYVGFEVHLAAAAYVERLRCTNNLTTARIFPVGLSDTPGVLQLQANDDHDVMATTVTGHYSTQHFAHTYPVVVERGDRILAGLSLGPIALIKIDVEGGELEVLRGLAETLMRDRPVLILEVAPYQHVLESGDTERAAFRRHRIGALEAFLHPYGYAFSRITQGGQLIPVTTLDPGMSRDTNEMDYVGIAR